MERLERAMVNLDVLSLHELLDIQKQLPSLIARRQEEVRKDILQKASALAAQHGLTLEEVMQKGRKRHATQYANPADLTQVWSGVGARPRWVREWLASGRTLKDLKLKEEG
jgi:DNA-binding protein H-NS